MRIRQLLALTLIGGSLVMSGCGSSPATRFYVLESTAPNGGAAIDWTVGLGPLQLPPYVDRDAIVTRSGPTTLDLAVFDHWAEPLLDGFGRVLAQDLASLVGTGRVERHPWGAAHVDVRVPVEVLRFDSDAEGTATLIARWSVTKVDHQPLAAPRVSTLTVRAESAGFPGTTDALSRAIGRLAAEIAAEVRSSGAP